MVGKGPVKPTGGSTPVEPRAVACGLAIDRFLREIRPGNQPARPDGPVFIRLYVAGGGAVKSVAGQHKIALMYYIGMGVPKDYVQAAKWYRLAADQGEASAQLSLGTMYSLGEGVSRDYVESAKWSGLAAGQGKALAQLELGRMYSLGHGVTQEDAQAAKWYRLAADQGNASAQFFLGVSYGLGRGLPQNLVLAHMWLNLAAARGDQLAKKARADTEQLLSPNQIAEAQKLASEWKPTAQPTK